MGDTSKFEFIAKEIKLTFWAWLRVRLSAFFGRKAFLRKFCSESGIDLPLIKGKRVVLPERYLVKDNNTIAYLGNIRDKAIVDAYDLYYEKHTALYDFLLKMKSRIAEQEKYLAVEKQRVEEYKAALKKEKDPQQIIFYESRIHEAEVRVANQSSRLAEMENSFRMHARLEGQNNATWKHQAGLIENYIAECISSYLKSLGKKIIKCLDYNEFKYIKPGYSDEVIDLLGGRTDAPIQDKK